MHITASPSVLLSQAMQRHLNGYIALPQIITDKGVAEYIVPSTWGNKAVSPVLCLAQP